MKGRRLTLTECKSQKKEDEMKRLFSKNKQAKKGEGDERERKKSNTN